MYAAQQSNPGIAGAFGITSALAEYAAKEARQPPVVAQLEVLHKAMAGLADAVSTLEGRLSPALPPRPVPANGNNPVGTSAGVGGGSTLYCQLCTLTDRAQELAAQIRSITGSLEI